MDTRSLAPGSEAKAIPFAHSKKLTTDDPRSVTWLLRAWTKGDSKAGDQVWPLVYRQLKGQAARLLSGEQDAHTLQPTALVHEAFLRLDGLDRLEWKSREHFFSFASMVMRRVLVEHARTRQRAKRGAGLRRVTLERAEGFRLSAFEPSDILMLDDALSRLAAIDARKASLLELRFFGGLSIAEAAEALGCSTATVERHSRLAKAWLVRELTPGPCRAGKP